MNIKYLGTFDLDEEGAYVSFWGGLFKYVFEITYDKEKDFEIYAKELRLNLKHQLHHIKVWRNRK